MLRETLRLLVHLHVRIKVQSLSPQKMTTNLCHLEMITLMINYLMAYFTLTRFHKCITGTTANRLCCWNNLCVNVKPNMKH